MSKNDMVIGLLPCPHCGRKEHEFHRYSRKIGFDVFYCIRCYCCAETIGQTESEAEQSWNTRVEPAQQHQGEPVALPARKDSTQHWVEPGGVHKAEGWNSYHDEIAKLGPLYTHADPNVRWKAVADEQMEVIAGLKAEVERLRAELDEWKKRCQYNADTAHDVGRERDTLRAQLAEAHALLRMFAENSDDADVVQLSNEHLSASAEPSAPVEIDERAEFEAWGADQGYFNLKREHSGKYKFQTAWAAWEGWQARAALERKP